MCEFLYLCLTTECTSGMLVMRLIATLTNQPTSEEERKLTFQDERPIFLQLAEQLEEGILSGAYPEESRVPSITEYSVTYKINPATALKGINLLVDSGLLYKKRGLGMFVATGAKEKVNSQRRNLFYCDYVEKLVREAKNLGLTAYELINMIERGFKDVD